MAYLRRQRRITRRHLLKTAGSLTGAALSGALGADLIGRAHAVEAKAASGTGWQSAYATDPIKIGVLLPESSLYLRMRSSLLAGLRLAVAQHNNHVASRQIELVPRVFGTLPSQSVPHARTLIDEEQVDLLIGAIGSSLPARLDDLIRRARVPLIVSHVGANIPRHTTADPLIARVSLQQWQAHWALGAWAARQVGRRALIAASFYESGYDTIYAFHHGFESAGGTIDRTIVTHQPSQPHDFATISRAVENAAPDVMFAAYSGSEATDFLQAYADRGFAGVVPLATSSFMLNDQPAAQQWSAASWGPQVGTDQNRSFMAAYQSQTGRVPDAFAALGYDTARLIVGAIDAVGGDVRARDSFMQALDRIAVDGPRGRVAMQPATRSASSPIYLHTHGAASVELAPPAIDAVRASLGDGPRTGWLTPYLCI